MWGRKKDGEKEERREEEVWHLGLNTGRDGGEWSHQHKSFMDWGRGGPGEVPRALWWSSCCLSG